MSLQFVIGSPGSGKTEYSFRSLIEKSLKEEKRQFILLVPEQFTLQTQADMVRLHPLNGAMNIDILSFERLAFRVFEEAGRKEPVLLNDLGKSLLLRKVAGERMDSLKLFRRNINKTGFIAEMKSLLSELCQYRQTAENLDALSKRIGQRPLLMQKLEEVSLLYSQFQKSLGDNTLPAEEVLRLLEESIPDSELLKDCDIVIDGFTGFTPNQYGVLRELLKTAGKITITLTLGNGAALEMANKEYDLFHLSFKTHASVKHLAKEAGAEILPEIRLKETGFRAPELRHLERWFLRFSPRPYDGEAGSIRIGKARTSKDEVSAAADEILRLVREEKLRFRDIAVITGDMEAMEPVFKDIFEKNGIPCFIDSKKEFAGTPLPTFLRSALDIVCYDFNYESIFRYLKSGLVNLSWNEIDEIENYVLACGIRGASMWKKAWRRKYRRRQEVDYEQLNQLRERIYLPLSHFYQSLKDKAATVQEFCEAVRQLMTDEGVEDILAGMGGELPRSFSQVKELLEQIEGLMGTEQISIGEFQDILLTGFEEIKTGIIPACLDQVVVGDMERSRLGHIKVLFFTCVCDGKVPKPAGEGGILSDREREYLKNFAVYLAPTVKEQSCIQKFYLYLTVTKPIRRLYLSYSGMDTGGKSQLPSPHIRSLKKLFPAIKEDNLSERLEKADYPASPAAARQMLAEGLRNYADGDKDSMTEALLRFFMNGQTADRRVMQCVDGAFFRYREESIGHEISRLLYGEPVSGSVTRLEKQAACAYAQFLEYGLMLNEREEYQVSALDIGNVFHEALERFFKKVKERKINWDSIDAGLRTQLVDECMDELMSVYEGQAIVSSALSRHLMERIHVMTGRTVWALGEQLSRGVMRPRDVEVNFTAWESDKMKIALPEGGEIFLRGKIDRIDIAEDDEHVYVKVVDYKSGNQSFDLISVYHGLQLQLVLYMAAAMELEGNRAQGKQIVPAGICYYNIKDPLIDIDKEISDEELEARILEKLKVNGLINSSPEVVRLMDKDFSGKSQVIPVTMKGDNVQEDSSKVASGYNFLLLQHHVEEKIRSLGQELVSGSVPVNPYKKANKTACDYCPYSAVCGFDLKSQGYSYRQLPDAKLEVVWEKMKAEQGKDKG